MPNNPEATSAVGVKVKAAIRIVAGQTLAQDAWSQQDGCFDNR
ncbi:MAG: hypothetical protein OEU50_20410 [Gammaproteobacteria bacterium]|nr:hypothetical protein [Gammaproteobacteria bacterium]